MRDLTLKILLTFFFLPLVHTAQEVDVLQRKFDSIYFDAATNIAGRDIQRALQIADSLYRHSLSDLHKIKSLMLSSTLYQQKGENEQTLEFALLAEKIADNANIYDWQARIAGFLSTQYRELGLYNKGRVYLDRGIHTSNKIADDNVKNLYLGMVYQESAYYAINDEVPRKAKNFVKLADQHFNKLPDGANKNYFLATNGELAGRVYLNLENYDAAHTTYNKALDLLVDLTEKDAVINGFIYSGLGKVHLAKEDYENACTYLTRAEQIAESSDFLNLKLEVYERLSEYHKAVGSSSATTLYKEKLYEAFKLKEANKSQSVSNFVDALEKENQALLTNRNFLIASSLVLVLAFVSIAVFYRRKKRKQFERFKVVIAELKQKDTLPALTITEEDTKTNGRKNIMSAEVEERILKELEKFEDSKKFTDKDMSISLLAGMLKTNTKYLSHVLNAHKNKDFNTYINSLRIKYIIHKLETDKDYKKYKISFLADTSGFSSHSKFTNVFKAVTGFTPSLFIEYLEKDKKENPTHNTPS